VSFTVLAVGEGRRTAKGCRKRTRANRGHRPCRLLTPRGRFARSKRAGRSRVAFTGRLGLGALARGRYVVRAVPTDTAAGRGRCSCAS
jgi:hypothetical protein